MTAIDPRKRHAEWDGRWQGAPPFPGMEQVYAGMFRRLSTAVPEDIELGFHLCYGDLDAAHFIDPVDATKMTELANLVTASAGRPVAYVHMPVPWRDGQGQDLSGNGRGTVRPGDATGRRPVNRPHNRSSIGKQ